MCREPGVEGEGGREKGLGTGKEASGGVSCGQLTGVQGHSMGQRRIQEAGCQGIGAAAVCALLRGVGAPESWALGERENLPSDTQAAAHPFWARAPLEWRLVGGECEVNPLKGGPKCLPVPMHSASCCLCQGRGSPRKHPGVWGSKSRAGQACRSARGT